MNLISFISNKKILFQSECIKNMESELYLYGEGKNLLKNEFHSFIFFLTFFLPFFFESFVLNVKEVWIAFQYKKEMQQDEGGKNSLKGFHVTSFGNFLSICFSYKHTSNMCFFAFISLIYPYQLSYVCTAFFPFSRMIANCTNKKFPPLFCNPQNWPDSFILKPFICLWKLPLGYVVWKVLNFKLTFKIFLLLFCGSSILWGYKRSHEYFTVN